MNVVLIGLSPRDQAALGLFMGRSLKGWTWQACAPERLTEWTDPCVFVLDLATLSMARHTAGAEADLAQLMHQRSVVLLVSSNDQSWQAADRLAPARSGWVWLGKPYGSDGMREALEKAAAHARTTRTVLAVAPQPTPAVLADPLPPAPMSPVALSSVAAPESEDDSQGLSAPELQAHLVQQPVANGFVFLRHLSEMLKQNQPFEARFTLQNCLVIHPQNGWVASNTPLAVIKRVCRSDALASVVVMRPLDGNEAEDLTQRLGMAPTALDLFLGQLVRDSLEQAHSASHP